MNDSSVFNQLDRILENAGIEEALDFLISHFREIGDHHQLFEALKMKVRSGLGLSLLYSESPDEMDEPTQRALEDGLLDACREVGVALFEQGDLREGWMYLQPIGDKKLTEKLFNQFQVDDENVNDFVDIALGQSAAPEIGYHWVLQHHGTCNAITTFDTQIAGFEKPVRKRLAAMLVEHIYGELLANVTEHIREQKGDVAPGTLGSLLKEHSWITEDGSHHIDTTHLASLMRIGQIVDDKIALQKLLQLAEYGSRLHSDFHYPGNPPFENTYEDHLAFYGALTGEKIDEGIQHFHAKVESVDSNQFGTLALETLIDLLNRVGKSTDAVSLTINQLFGSENQLGLAPNVFEIAQSKDELQLLVDYYKQQDDLLGYSVGKLQQRIQP